MTDYLFAGIDLHKKYSFITLKDQSGQNVFQDKVVNDKLALQNTFSQFNNPTRAAVEATFNSLWLVDSLKEIGINTLVINPKKTKAIAHAKIKTDKIDSETIADLNLRNYLSISYVPSMEERELRDITRHRLDLVHLRTSLKNRVINILHRNCIFEFPYSDMFSKKAQKWILSLSDLSSIEISSIKRLLRIINLFSEEITSLEEIIKQKADSNPAVKLLTTIPGMAHITGLTIICEIGNIHRFHSAKALCSFAGLVPSTYSSGGKTKHGKITKEGNKYVRYALSHVIKHLKDKNKKINEFYNRIKSRKCIKVARTACMRKTLIYIYYMLKDHKKFSELPVSKE